MDHLPFQWFSKCTRFEYQCWLQEGNVQIYFHHRLTMHVLIHTHAHLHTPTLQHSNNKLVIPFPLSFSINFESNMPDVRGLTATIQDKLFDDRECAVVEHFSHDKLHIHSFYATKKRFRICVHCSLREFTTWNEYRINFSDNCMQSWHGSMAKLSGLWPNAMAEITTLEIMLSWVQFGLFKSTLPYYCVVLCFANDLMSLH